MDTLESNTSFIENMNPSITDNNKLTMDDISYRTYNQLSSIEELLKELKNENEQLLTDPSGYSFIFKRYKKLVFYRKDQYIN